VLLPLFVREGGGFVLRMPTKVSEDGRDMTEMVPLVCQPEKKLIIHGVLESALKPITFLKQSAAEKNVETVAIYKTR